MYLQCIVYVFTMYCICIYNVLYMYLQCKCICNYNLHFGGTFFDFFLERWRLLDYGMIQKSVQAPRVLQIYDNFVYVWYGSSPTGPAIGHCALRRFTDWLCLRLALFAMDGLLSLVLRPMHGIPSRTTLDCQPPSLHSFIDFGPTWGSWSDENTLVFLVLLDWSMSVIWANFLENALYK